MANWTFFTNYGHVLFTLANNPELSIREIAQEVGITERATARIISDLTKDDFLSITKVGRKNQYTINLSGKLRHPIEENSTVGELVSLIKKSKQK